MHSVHTINRQGAGRTGKSLRVRHVKRSFGGCQNHALPGNGGEKMDAIISYYRSLATPGDQFTTPLTKWLKAIRSGKWQGQMTVLRTEYRQNGKSKRYQWLKEGLGAPTPGGIFTYREKDQLKRASGILHADIDDMSLVQVEEASDRLRRDPHVLYLFVSPSGHGVKFGVPIPIVVSDAGYKRFYFGLELYTKEIYGLTLDPSCKDISRLCFNSYDPELHYNHNARLFTDVRDAPDTPTQDAPIAIPLPSTPPIPGWYAPNDSPRLQWAIRELQAAPLGTRNATRIRVARLIGGLIAGNQLSQSAAHLLADVAASCSKHPQKARVDIAKGLAYGYGSPIYPEQKYNRGFRSRFSAKGVANA